MQEKRTESPMTKVARFIVDKRKAFYLVFIAAFVFCAASINKVQVNNDITSYLPAQTETRRGLTIMDEEFITLGSANVMVSNVTYQTALDLSKKLERIEGVSEVVFDSTEEHYKNSSALFTISFDGEDWNKYTCTNGAITPNKGTYTYNWGVVYALKNQGTNEAYRLRWRIVLVGSEAEQARNPRCVLVVERYPATARDALSMPIRGNSTWTSSERSSDTNSRQAA